MALTASIVNFKIVMDRDAFGGPVFTFTDLTDYAGNGVTFADVKGAIKIQYGGFTYYDNLANVAVDPDIDCSDAGQVNGNATRANTKPVPIALPTDANGNVVSGQYTFTYTVTDGVATVSNTVVIDATFELPQGKLTGTVDLTPTSPNITVIDETNYVVRNITPAAATPQITLYYPGDAGAAPTVVSASLLEVVIFYTGQQVARLSAPKVWDYSSKIVSQSFTSLSVGDSVGTFFLEIHDTVTARVEIDVELNNSICALFCCLTKFAEKLEAAKGRPTEYARLLDIAGTVAFYYQSISAAYDCSKTENVNQWAEDIRALVKCGDDCACDGDEPVQISPITGAGDQLSFLDLNDTPSSYTGEALRLVRVNAAQDALEFTDNVDTFIKLTDTPASYAGEALKIVQVKSTEDGVEFTNAIEAASVKLTGGVGNQGLMTWNTDEETVDLVTNGETIQIGQDLEYHVRNTSGSTIPKGTPVMATGTIGNSGRITVSPMDGTVVTNAKFFLGLADEDILDTEDGKISSFGKIRGVNASGSVFTAAPQVWNDGDVIWIDTTTVGKLTNVAPTSGMKLPIAFVISNNSNGTLFVRATNGTSINEANDIELTSLTSAQILQYNGTSWINTSNSLITTRKPSLDIPSSTVLQPALAGHFIYSTAGAPVTFDIDTQANANWERDTEIEILQYGATAITVTAPVGVTLNGVSGNSINLPGAYRKALLKNLGPDLWVLA